MIFADRKSRPNARRKRRARYVAARLDPFGTLSSPIREQIRGEPYAISPAARRLHEQVFFPTPFPHWRSAL